MNAPLRDRYEKFYPKNRRQWRDWLAKHHQSSPGVWLVYYRKDAGQPYVEYNDAVEEAICFGWIDSLMQPEGDGRYIQLFTPRKPKSGWSKTNKERVVRLLAQELIAPAGLEKIEAAKKDGSWNALDDVENLVVPTDLERALKKAKGAWASFQAWTPGVRKQCLYQLQSAKKPETRAKRIAKIVDSARRRTTL